VIDIVVYVQRTPQGRHVHEILAVPEQLDADVFTVSGLYQRGDTSLRWMGAPPESAESWRT
jgi:predicted metal-dependent phosphotriesterase family hydrolase